MSPYPRSGDDRDKPRGSGSDKRGGSRGGTGRGGRGSNGSGTGRSEEGGAGRGGYQGSRPSSGGYQGSRPSSGGYRGGYQGSRPSSGGYQGSRPSSGGYQGSRPSSGGYQGSRPSSGGYGGGYAGAGDRSGGTRHERPDRPRSGPPVSPGGSVWGGVARGGGGYRGRDADTRGRPDRGRQYGAPDRGRSGPLDRGRPPGGPSWRNDDSDAGSRRAGRPPAPRDGGGDLSEGRSVSRAATAGRNLWSPSPRAGSAGTRGPIIKRSPHSLGGEQVEGRQAVRELLSARHRQVTEVWMTEGSDPSPILGEIDRLAREAHVPVRLVSQRRLESVQGTDSPQGVVAFAEPLTAASLDDLVLGWAETADAVGSDRAGSGRGADAEVGSDVELEPGTDEPEADAPVADAPVADASATGALVTASAVRRALQGRTEIGSRPSESAFLVLLEGVTDPQNLGAILRSAECAGVTGVAVPRHRSVHVTPAVTKAAAGAIEYLQMALVAGMPSALQDLERLGVMTIGLDESGTTSLYDLDIGDRSVAIVLGSEGSGLSPLSRRRCEVLCKIPVDGEIPSLNVSAAAAVACFEVAHQRAKRTRPRGKRS